MSDLNETIQIGRLTADPEFKTTKGGGPICNFSIAVSRTWKEDGEKKEKTSFFRCAAFGKLAEVISQHTKKGERVGIKGRLEQSKWEDKDGNKRDSVGIVVEKFQFLSERKKDEGQAPPESYEDNPFDDK